MSDKMKKHFLYCHTRNDTGKVFYVGIGTQKPRQKYRRARDIKGHNKYWDRIYAKAGRTVHILCESDNYNYIKQKEVLHIKYYGKENLCNITDGGDGSLGRECYFLGKPRQEDVKALISKNRKGKGMGRIPWNKGIKTGKPSWIAGRTHPEETKKKIGLAGIGRKPRNKGIAHPHKGNPCSFETRKKISDANKAAYARKRNMN